MRIRLFDADLDTILIRKRVEAGKLGIGLGIPKNGARTPPHSFFWFTLAVIRATRAARFGITKQIERRRVVREGGSNPTRLPSADFEFPKNTVSL